MTWKEFKDKVESQKVTDNTKIRYIDVDSMSKVEVREYKDVNTDGIEHYIF